MAKFRTALAIVPLIALLLTTQAHAAQAAECELLQGISWRESSTLSFTVIYPPEFEWIGRSLTTGQQREILDQEYARFETLFENSLPTPVSIRIYPDVQSFSCLNPGIGPVSSDLVHTPAGSREIALIGNNVQANYPVWVHNEVNLIRQDLAVLFALQIGGDKIPPGLQTAIGHYAQDPSETVGKLRLNWVDWQSPSDDWRGLWQSAWNRHDLAHQLQSTSTVAYLVDTYGWTTFLNFLHRLPAAPTYAAALSQVYGVDLTDLETGWRVYYPAYMQGGWQRHPIYNYDLSPYLDLMRAEQYAEADRGIHEAIAFLEKMQDPEKLNQARALLVMAQRGQEAERLFVLSQQALQAGDYQASVDFLDQAEQKYHEAGTRSYHLDEFSGYRQRVNQILNLHADLEDLAGRVRVDWNTFALSSSLLKIGREFASLQDLQGHTQVKILAEIIAARQREQLSILTAGVLLMILPLLVLLVRAAARAVPPEAKL